MPTHETFIGLMVNQNSNWYVNYRPSRMRVTGEYVGSISPVQLEDFGANSIAYGQGASVAEFTLDWTNGLDIYRITLPGYNTVTNIEFYDD